MIRFENVSKGYKLKSGRKIILDQCSIELPARARIGVLGINGAGKSTLLRMLSGGEPPDAGRIVREGRVSFPVGFTGTFHPMHTARENINFLAHVYGMDSREVSDWVEDFSELGNYFDMPVGTYSSGMYARIAFATSFAFDFDVYLVDEAIETGDAQFRKKCARAFDERLKSSSLILVSHNMNTIREYCDQYALLCDGKILLFSSIEDTLQQYDTILKRIR